MARPRPDPCGLVVKNALKMRSRSSLRHARPVVGDFDDDRARRVRVAARAVQLFLEHAFARRHVDGAAAFERLEGVDQQVGEELAELMMVSLDRRQPFVHPHLQRRSRAAGLSFRPG